MNADNIGTVARLDDGVYTHVKIDGKLFRVANVIEAVRFYLKQKEKEHDNDSAIHV